MLQGIHIVLAYPQILFPEDLACLCKQPFIHAHPLPDHFLASVR